MHLHGHLFQEEDGRWKGDMHLQWRDRGHRAHDRKEDEMKTVYEILTAEINREKMLGKYCDHKLIEALNISRDNLSVELAEKFI